MGETARTIVALLLLLAAFGVLGVLGCATLTQPIIECNGTASMCSDEMGNLSVVCSDGVPGGCFPMANTNGHLSPCAVVSTHLPSTRALDRIDAPLDIVEIRTAHFAKQRG